jgi:uncharacterized membrane protein (Fun14 family)
MNTDKITTIIPVIGVIITAILKYYGVAEINAEQIVLLIIALLNGFFTNKR